jgi:hypothetical protein
MPTDKVSPGCEDFVRLIRSAVIPLRDANPTWTRLDGRASGGSRNTFAKFEYLGKGWAIHEDTHFEPLMLAYESAVTGVDPFIIADTDRGQRLELNPDLASQRAGLPRYLYIYNWE